MFFLIKAFGLILSPKDILKFYLISSILIVVAVMEVAGLALISFLIVNLNNLDNVLETSGIFTDLLIFFRLSNADPAFIFCIIIICYSALNVLISLASIRYISVYTQILGAHIKSKVLRHFLYLNWIDLTKLGSSESMSRVINDGNEVADTLYFLMHLLSKFALSLLIVSLLLIFNTNLTLVLVGMLFAAYAIIFFVSKPIVAANSLNQTRLLDSILKVVKNMFGSLKEIIFYNTHQKVLSNFSELNKDYAKAKGSNIALSHMPRSIIDSLILIILVVLLLIMQIQNLEPTVFLSTISIYGIAALKLLPAFQNIFYFSHEIYVRFPYLENISDLFMKINKSEIIDTNDHETPLDFTSTIDFKNVSFKYPKSNVNSLNNINFCLHKGEKIAIVGPSGSGKSTFIDILLGFMEPGQGHIYLDGEVLIHSSLNRYRKNFTYVPQKIYFFEGTFKENLLFNSLSIVSEDFDLEKIIEGVYLKDFVASLPLGIETVISDEYQIVSGGQKQCIGIARALLRGGNTLILDEATSAMDSSLEKKIYEFIFKSNFSNIISVTHKPALLQRFDKIYVFKDGSIEDVGSFKELSSRSSFFVKMLNDYSSNLS